MEPNIKFGVAVIKEQVKLMPNSPGVYKMLDANSKILYIGKAKNLPKRVSNYASFEKLTNRLKRMVTQIKSIEYITTGTESEALLLEANLIKTLKPVYNICLRDDKSFPYILIEDNHEYPRISKYRGIRRKGGSFFGPFASAGNVNETIAELQKIFLIRPCSDNYFKTRVRPCLQHQIHRCSAPCVGKISVDAYSKLIMQTKDFLSGRSHDIQTNLKNEMESASQTLDYERAAILRDRIKLLTNIQAKNTFSNSAVDDADIIGLYQNEHGDCCIQIFFIRGGKNYGNRAYYPSYPDIGIETLIENFIGQFYQRQPPPKQIVISHKLNSTKVLEEALFKLAGAKSKIIFPQRGTFKDIIEFVKENAKSALIHHAKEKLKNLTQLNAIAELFEISEVPKRIEVYDNSHIQGGSAVGCMIVANSMGFDKNEYRVFNIKSAVVGDDYTMLKEVLKRRLAKLNSENYPGLILVDGGKGHLTVAQEVFDSFGINDIKLVCISKGRDRNAGREFFHQTAKPAFQLPKRDKNLHYLQVLRDEAHRFAIETHRRRRSKQLTISGLDAIPSIGLNRKKILLTHFGSLEAIKNSLIADLLKVPGISKKTAEIVYNFFRKSDIK